MKFLYPTLFIILLSFVGCNTNKTSNLDKPIENKMAFEPDENGEYDIIVMDPQYEIYLKTIANPQSFNSHEYYKTKNRIFATIWNQRHSNPLAYNPDLYAVSIDLDPQIEYGEEFEYKLFNFFKFIEWKYRVRLI